MTIWNSDEHTYPHSWSLVAWLASILRPPIAHKRKFSDFSELKPRSSFLIIACLYSNRVSLSFPDCSARDFIKPLWDHFWHGIFSIVGRYHIEADCFKQQALHTFIVHRPNPFIRWTVRVVYRPSSWPMTRNHSVVKSVREVCPPPFTFHKLSGSESIHETDGLPRPPEKDGNFSSSSEYGQEMDCPSSKIRPSPHISNPCQLTYFPMYALS